eukprot:TRINITY_DN19577_c2_g1_i2.p2 TRINITY_DN19577_c2_g1~~TRINITY_DN19577_c2_g1_i2.p2  ORF type:complete len:622 (+),score=162.26 TRINITY_DN19577_c2_g1_i2:65-1930(+)
MRRGAAVALAAAAAAQKGPRHWVARNDPCDVGWSWLPSAGEPSCVRLTPTPASWNAAHCKALRSDAELATVFDPDAQQALGAFIGPGPLLAWVGLTALDQGTRLGWKWPDPTDPYNYQGASGPGIIPFPLWAHTRPKPDPSGQQNCAYMSGTGAVGPGRCVYPTAQAPGGGPFLCEAPCSSSFAYACAVKSPTGPTCNPGWTYTAALASCVRILKGRSEEGPWADGPAKCRDPAKGGVPGADLAALVAKGEAQALKAMLGAAEEVWVGLHRVQQAPLDWAWENTARAPFQLFGGLWAPRNPSGAGACAYMAAAPPPPPPARPPPPPPPPPPYAAGDPSASPMQSPTGSPSAEPSCPAEGTGELCDGDCDMTLQHLCQYWPVPPRITGWAPQDMPMAPMDPPTQTRSIAPPTPTVTHRPSPTGTRTRSLPVSPSPTGTASRPVTSTPTVTKGSRTKSWTPPWEDEAEDNTVVILVVLLVALLCVLLAALARREQLRRRRTYAPDHLAWDPTDSARGGAGGGAATPAHDYTALPPDPAPAPPAYEPEGHMGTACGPESDPSDPSEGSEDSCAGSPFSLARDPPLPRPAAAPAQSRPGFSMRRAPARRSDSSGSSIEMAGRREV